MVNEMLEDNVERLIEVADSQAVIIEELQQQVADLGFERSTLVHTIEQNEYSLATKDYRIIKLERHITELSLQLSQFKNNEQKENK